tara:strand:+ start:2405 stop:2908 length:504 start_codon:yes stop_codon:yes gene_type:complete
MELTKRGAKNLSITKTTLIVIILIIAIWFFFFSNIIKKNCSTIQCFDEQSIQCKPTKFTGIVDNNIFKYTIKGSEGDNCKIKIELDKMGVGTPIELIDLFEGRSMECNIPQNRMKEVSINKMQDVINFCTGSLKESIYELVIKKLYGLVVQNMDEILEDIDKNLFEE